MRCIRLRQPNANPGLRRDALVVTELGGQIIPGIVVDDDVDNPIRMIMVEDHFISVFADDIEEVCAPIFEFAVYLRQERKIADIASEKALPLVIRSEVQ